jgi:hypothetical protein
MPATSKKPRHALSTVTPLKKIPEATRLPGDGYERRFPIHRSPGIDPFAEWSSGNEEAENQVAEDDGGPDAGQGAKGEREADAQPKVVSHLEMT